MGAEDSSGAYFYLLVSEDKWKAQNQLIGVPFKALLLGCSNPAGRQIGGSEPVHDTADVADESDFFEVGGQRPHGLRVDNSHWEMKGRCFFGQRMRI